MIGVLGGKLIHRVRLQSRVETSRGSAGGVIESWTTDDTLWANVRPVSGRERLAGLQLAASTTHTVRLRFKATITPKMRLLHDIRSDVTDLATVLGVLSAVTSDTAVFTADMVGQYLTIAAGDPWIAGDYRITEFVSSTRLTLDRDAASSAAIFGDSFVNRQLEITDVIDVEEDKVITELHCVERTA